MTIKRHGNGMGVRVPSLLNRTVFFSPLVLPMEDLDQNLSASLYPSLYCFGWWINSPVGKSRSECDSKCDCNWFTLAEVGKRGVWVKLISASTRMDSLFDDVVVSHQISIKKERFCRLCGCDELSLVRISQRIARGVTRLISEVNKRVGD